MRAGDGAPRRPTPGPLQRNVFVVHAQGTCTQWATTGVPDAFRAATSVRRGSGTQGTNPCGTGLLFVCPQGMAHAEQGTWGSHTTKHREGGCGRPEDGGVWTAKTVKLFGFGSFSFFDGFLLLLLPVGIDCGHPVFLVVDPERNFAVDARGLLVLIASVIKTVTMRQLVVQLSLHTIVEILLQACVTTKLVQLGVRQ